MREKLRVLEPVPDVHETGHQTLCQRVPSLRGRTVLLLDNRKTSAYELLQKIGSLLRVEQGVGDIISLRKQPDYLRAITRAELGGNIGRAHVAVTALGD
jgi:hypothetical protein